MQKDSSERQLEDIRHLPLTLQDPQQEPPWWEKPLFKAESSCSPPPRSPPAIVPRVRTSSAKTHSSTHPDHQHFSIFLSPHLHHQCLFITLLKSYHLYGV